MTLEELRKQIDAVDAQLLQLFLQRQSISEAIGSYKKEQGLPVLDEVRQQEKLDGLCKLAGEENEAAVRSLFEELMRLSRAHQEGEL